MIESQRFEIKNTVLKNYIPEEVVSSEELTFVFDGVGQKFGTKTNNEINNILNQLNFLRIFQDAEKSSGSSLSMKSLSELIEVNNYYATENDIYCSDPSLILFLSCAYFWPIVSLDVFIKLFS